MGRRILKGMVAVVLIPLLAHAGPPPRPPPPPPPTPPPADVPPPPPPPPPAAVECFPACRPGFFCYQGQCRSACNPPCAAGETCMDNGQCVPGTGEPPPPPPPDDTTMAGPPPPGGLMVSDDGEQAPPGYHWETKRRRGMLIAGPVLLGVGWIISIFYGFFGFLFAGLSFSSSGTNMGWAYQNRGTFLVYLVPVVGPAASQFMQAVSPGYRDSASRTLELGWMVILSALQLSGALLTIFGIPTSQVLVEDRRADADSKLQDGLSVGWAPGAPGSPAGFTLLGSF